MNLQNEIKDFVISFFGIIKANFVHDDGVYRVSIPAKYQDYFHKSEIAITFDRDVLSRHNCEMVLPGSIILGIIIKICSHSGAISLKKADISDGKTILRYHFFVNFSGLAHTSRFVHVDIDSETCKPVYLSSALEDTEFSLDVLNDKNITSSYMAAIDIIKKKCHDLEEQFVADANKELKKDFELFILKFDSQIRDLDNRIHKKENNGNDFEEARNFRFETIDKIKQIESEKTRLIDTLQKKHQIDLEYRLVACEIIQA